jgi:hypothetical protein
MLNYPNQMASETDQIVLISFFQFPGNEGIWAMKQMGLRPRKLNDIHGISFHKMLGTGGGYGYGFIPDFNTYALLTVWDELKNADDFESGSETMFDFRQHTEEIFSVFMSPVMSRGQWSGINPFRSSSEIEKGDRMAVITRATLKPHFIVPFWRKVKGVSNSQIGSRGLLFSKGVGERPWIMQATYTIWENQESMKSFAYDRSGKHAEAIAMTRKKEGFREELYARFKVIETRGSWKGNDPVNQQDY